FGFILRRSTGDAIFALRMLMEKYREGQNQLDYVFIIYLEKEACARIPRKDLRESSIPEVYVRVAQDMYNECMTAVRSTVGTTEGFKMGVRLHQGSALSLFLFAVIMGKLTVGLRKGAPWSVMFADDTVLCRESKGEVEEHLERWRHALEKRGRKFSRRKTISV
ncbi:uncharacterized protein LOC134789301, partial [Penaeus indicus]|uniref:uncharacterized protein LOC134789301 n=1 Tax=Penaeus indicus TaxID=29960 RepID=UPI00300D2394